MPNPNPPQADATQLRCQLDPLSTPQLRGRLDRLFGQPTHPDEVDRHAVLSRLLEAYGALGARTVLQMRGVLPRADAPMAALLAELRATSFPSGAQREHGARGSGPPVGVEEARERRYYAQQEREQTQALEEEAAAQHQRRARLGASLEHTDNPVDTPPTVAKVESLEQVPRPPRTNHHCPPLNLHWPLL